MTTSTIKLPDEIGKLLFSSSFDSDDAIVDNVIDCLTYVHPSIAVVKARAKAQAKAAGDDETSSTSVIHGRGLVNQSSTETIKAGDVLFVTPPTIEAPIESVLRFYQKNNSTTTTKNNGGLLEEIAETILLKEMKRRIRKLHDDLQSKAIVDSFLLLQSQHNKNGDGEEQDENEDGADLDLFSTLLGQTIESNSIHKTSTATHGTYSDDYLRGIIRQNAFGPDFHHYDRMEKELAAANSATATANNTGQSSSGSSSNNNNNNIAVYYHRILGIYPLAAMINHSCMTNATRTFVAVKNSNLMVATATQNIPPRTEIVWSYIPPTTDYTSRQQALQHYGFKCYCQRCMQDDATPSLYLTLQSFKLPISTAQQTQSLYTISDWSDIMQSLQDVYDNTTPTKARSTRLSYTQLYIRYFNETLLIAQQQESEQPMSSTSSMKIYNEILYHAAQLHWSFCIIHNASTEHISIVHLCYELASQIKRNNMISTNNINNNADPHFWMEQLKRVHKCRYSKYIIRDEAPHEATNNNIQDIKRLLQHTRSCLRTATGWRQTKYRFI